VGDRTINIYTGQINIYIRKKNEKPGTGGKNMGMDIETLKKIGKDIDGPVSRKGTGKKNENSGSKLPRADPCTSKGSKWCINRCRGHSHCPKHIHNAKELAGYTLVQAYMGIATTHPEWVGKWKKL